MSNVLKHLFPVPKDDRRGPPAARGRGAPDRLTRRLCRARARSKRVVTFANQADFISFRHHTYDQPRGAKSVSLKEVRSRAATCSALGSRC